MVTKKTKIVLYLSSSAVLLAFFLLYLVWNDIQKTGELLQQETTAIANFEARNQSYRELERLIETTQSEREQLQTYVLTEEKTIDFLSMIESLAIEQGVDLSTESLKVEPGDDVFDTLMISYRTEGMKTRVASLLLLLESLPYQSVVSDISLQYYQEDGVAMINGIFTINVTLIKYD